jgi:hypothetical protein
MLHSRLELGLKVRRPLACFELPDVDRAVSSLSDWKTSPSTMDQRRQHVDARPDNSAKSYLRRVANVVVPRWLDAFKRHEGRA